MNFSIYSDVEDIRFEKALPNISTLIEEVKTEVVACIKTKVPFLSLPKNFSVNLCLSDDPTIQALNKQFRQKDAPTNVLSFALVDDPSFASVLEEESEVELGDIIISYETTFAQAQEQDISFEAHFCHLLCHGLLHILGYDHIKEEEAQKMESLETEILAKLNIENPYD